MNIQLIEGQFSQQDALELITQMVHVKIKFHERKISNSLNEEDIKARENKIKRLQKELYELRQHIDHQNKFVQIDSIINLK